MEEWKAFFKLEPWGYEEKDLQESYTRYSFAQSQGVKKTNGEELTQADYSMEHVRQTIRKKAKSGLKKQDPEEMKRLLLARFS